MKTINETKYNEWIDEGFNLNKHNSVDVYFNQTISVNGYFRDDRAFAFTYGDGLVNTDGEPRYKNFYCVYCYGSDFYKKVIFNSTIDTPYTYTPRVSSTKLAISADTETSGTSGSPYYNIITSNNLTDVQFVYVNENGATTYTAYLTNLNLGLSLFSPAYPPGNGTSCSGTSILLGNYKIADNDGNVIDSGQIYNEINVSLDVMSKQGYVQNFTTSYFSFNVDVSITGDATVPSNSHIHVIPGTPGSSSGSGSYITISAGNISGTDVISGTLLEGKPAATAQSMPNLYVAFKEQRMSIAVDFTASIPNDVSYDNYRGIYRIERDNTGETRPRIIYSKLYPGSVPVVRPPLRDGLIISNGRYMFTTLEKEGEKKSFTFIL